LLDDPPCFFDANRTNIVCVAARHARAPSSAIVARAVDDASARARARSMNRASRARPRPRLARATAAFVRARAPSFPRRRDGRPTDDRASRRPASRRRATRRRPAMRDPRFTHVSRTAHMGLKITEYVENRSRRARARVDPAARPSQSTPPVF
jgi:hypothetical protein